MSDSASPSLSPSPASSPVDAQAHANAYADTEPAGLTSLPSSPAADASPPGSPALDLPAAAAARARLHAGRAAASAAPAVPAETGHSSADGFADSSFADSHFVESQFLDAAEFNTTGDESGSSRRCPHCGSRVKRILRTANDKRRWDADDWRRYRCRGEGCDWQGLMQASSRGRKRRSAPAQPTVTTARPRWALTLLAMLLAAALSWGAMQTLAAMTGL